MIAFLEQAELAHLALQPQPLVRQRCLPHEGRQQHGTVGGDRIGPIVMREAQHGERAECRLERVELPVGGGERGGAAPRGLAPRPAPFGRGVIDRAERRGLRIRCRHGQHAIAFGQQQRVAVEQQPDLRADRRCGLLPGGGACQRLREGGDLRILSRAAC